MTPNPDVQKLIEYYAAEPVPWREATAVHPYAIRLLRENADRFEEESHPETAAILRDAAALLARCESEREPDAWEWNRKSEHGFHHECPNQSHVTLREISIDARDKDTTIYHYGCKQCGSFWHERVMLRAGAPVAQPEPREPDAWPEHACRFCGGTIHPDVLVHWQGDARVQAGNVHQMCYERYNSAPIASPPTMTDLMVTPESLSGYDGASPVPEAAAAWVRGCKCDSPWDTGAGQPYRCLKCGAWWITPAPDAEWNEMRDAANEYIQDLGRFGDRPSYAGRLLKIMEAADAYVTGLHAKVAELERAPAEPDLGGFVIWSGEHGAWWRAHRSGYTKHLLAAGVYTKEDAVAATRHCGPEKMIEIQPLSEQYGLVSLDGTVAARLLERAAAAQQAYIAEIKRMDIAVATAHAAVAPDTRDTERLDFLDQCKGWHNAHDGYVLLHLGWYKDSPAKTLREAIDAALREQPKVTDT